jgi:hypothetical protein
VWSLFDQVPAARAAGREVGAGVVVLDVDATLLLAHSEKEGADKTYKHTASYFAGGGRGGSAGKRSRVRTNSSIVR